MSGLIGKLLSHPLTRGLSVDDPETTIRRRAIVRGKSFLNALYREWYSRLAQSLEPGGRVLEIGSGAGFMKEIFPGIITSEIFLVPGVDLVADGRRLPFSSGDLDGIVMTDVFHHIPDVSAFLIEAARCVKVGGRLTMLEPWRTPWAEWVYRHLHSEPFEPDAGWEIPEVGPLSGANGALPWIVFERDRHRFITEHPEWGICRVEPMMPFAYLLSGGVSMRSLAPGYCYRMCRVMESWLNPSRWAMFALIELERLP